MNHVLVELQEVDNALQALARDKAKLDDGTSARGKRDELKAGLESETKNSHKLTADRTDNELQLKAAEDKLKKQQARLMTATSAHEITALERDIQGLNHARSDLDESILNLMDELETSTAKVDTLTKDLAAAEKQLAEIEAAFAKDTQRIQVLALKHHQDRQAVAAKLSTAEKAQYDLVAKRHAGIAVAKLVNGNCSVCGTTIPLVLVREAKTKDFPTCESCGRLLYVG